MIKIFKFLIIILAVVFSNTTFWSSWEIVDNTEIQLNSADESIDNNDENKKSDEWKKIRVLKSEVNTLNEQNEETNKKFDNLKKEILIARFFKTNLTNEEQEELSKLVLEYKETKDKLNKQLLLRSKTLENTESTIKKLLENEKEIYKNLIQFIQIEKYEEYKEFIKKDLNIINESSNLKSQTVKKESILENKINNIKEKIREHNELLSKKLKELVINKIDIKLKELINKETFKKLDKDSQIKLFEKLILNLKTKKEMLDTKENKTRLLVKKIELYKVIIKRIELFKTYILEAK